MINASLNRGSSSSSGVIQKTRFLVVCSDSDRSFFLYFPFWGICEEIDRGLMFPRNAPSSILSRGCRYILRASGYRHHHHHHQSQIHSLPVSLARSSSRSLSLSLRPQSTSSLLSQIHRHRFYSTVHTTETTTMADASETGVTADSLRSKLIEQLQAQYVEIEDLSGMVSLPGCGFKLLG